MLYDKKWDKKIETRAEPFTRAHVIAWLETKNPEAEYCYTDSGRCLIAQYVEHIGHTHVSVGSLGYWCSDQQPEDVKAPVWLWQAAIGGLRSEWTFGGALNRLRDTCGND